MILTNSVLYISRYPWSKALHLKCLQNQSQATIAWNAKDIMTSADWPTMDYDFLQVLRTARLRRQSCTARVVGWFPTSLMRT